MRYGLLKTMGVSLVRGWLFIIHALVLTLVCPSCNNDHCDESMYAPLGLSFYSELDTSVQVTPPYLLVKGVGSDSLMSLGGAQRIYIPLNPNLNESRFLWVMEPADGAAPVDISTDTVWSGQKLERVRYLLDGRDLVLHKIVGDAYVFGGDTIFFYQKGFFYEPCQDTLNVSYDLHQEFLSGECGYLTTFYLKSLRFSSDKVGEIMITNRSVTNKYNERHVNIYLENY